MLKHGPVGSEHLDEATHLDETSYLNETSYPLGKTPVLCTGVECSLIYILQFQIVLLLLNCHHECMIEFIDWIAATACDRWHRV